MLKLCTLISPGKRINNIVGLVTLMSVIPPSKPLCVTVEAGGGDGGNEQEGYFTMQPMGLGLVIPSLGRS